MGKHEPMTAKAIGIKIKSKGLQKIKFYCQMCQKQCRDDNGFKCHIQSESHQRQALIVSENPHKFVDEYSKDFMDGFMYILKIRYKSKKILANTIFQEYIKERDNVHMNATRWITLSDFAYWLAEQGYVEAEDSERGVLIKYIDNDPDTIKRKELDKLKAKQAREAAERADAEIKRQMENSKKSIDDCRQKEEAFPIPIEKIIKSTLEASSDCSSDSKTIGNHQPINVEVHYEDVQSLPCGPSQSSFELASSIRSDQQENSEGVIERPVFKIQAFSLKPSVSSKYKKPEPKKRSTKIKRTKVT